MVNKSSWYKVLILIVGILLFFVNLGAVTVDIMEARNFVTVREMLETGDWLHPTMNGILRLEKPPFPTWITALFASVFGLKSLFLLRLPAALMSLWLLFSMNSLVKRLTQDKLLAMLSALSLAGMLYVIILGRRGMWDIYTHSFMLAAIVQFVAIAQSNRPLIRGLWGGILFGAAFLSKGPVTLYALLFPFLVLYVLNYHTVLHKKHRLSLFVFFLVGILVSASWFIYIYSSYGATEQVLAKEITNWHSYNVKSWYYYLKDYPVHSGVWTVILAMGLFTKYTYNKSRDRKNYLFFWCWAVSSVLLLSIIPEKKVRYLLPTFIPAAFLVASYFYYLICDFNNRKEKVDTIILKIHTSIFVGVALGLPIVFYILCNKVGLVKWGQFTGVILLSLFCLYLFWKSWNSEKKYFLLVGILGLLTSVVCFILPQTDTMANSEYHSIEEVQTIEKARDLPCYALEETRIELVWLIGRKIKEVQTLDDLQPPYLLLTDKPSGEYVIPYPFESVGYYDNNSKPKGHKHYQESLSKHVILVQ